MTNVTPSGITKREEQVMVDIAKNISEMTQIFNTGSLQDLQLAGNISVEVTGPAIDQLSGSSPDVMQLTHLAWQKNGELAGASDVFIARDAFQQMASWYNQAYNLALAKARGPAAAPAYHTPAPTAYKPATPLAAATSPSKAFPIVPALIAVGTGVIGFATGGLLIGAVAAAVGFGIGTKIENK